MDGLGGTLATAAGMFVGTNVDDIIDIVERYGQWLVPAVFIGVGGLIVAESDVLAKIF